MMANESGRYIRLMVDVDTGEQKWSTHYGTGFTGRKRPLHHPHQPRVWIKRAKMAYSREEMAQEEAEQKAADEKAEKEALQREASTNTVRRNARLLLGHDPSNLELRQEVDDVKNALFSHWLRMNCAEYKFDAKLAAANEQKELREMMLAEKEQKLGDALVRIYAAEDLARQEYQRLQVVEAEEVRRLNLLADMERIQFTHPYVFQEVVVPEWYTRRQVPVGPSWLV